MAPRWVRTGVRRIGPSDITALWPIERRAVAGAVDHRQAEFATGRALLRSLIGQEVAIPVGAMRRPVWPVGVTGTLAHDHELAVAAVSTRASPCALGVDVEPATVLPDDMAKVICSAQELHLDAHLVFVLKEAAYKAWSSLGGGLLEHHDVLVRVEPQGSFRATILPTATTFTGRYAFVGARHLALIASDRHERVG
jgi:4'-phosphopantetheinyl transferase EntD